MKQLFLGLILTVMISGIAQADTLYTCVSANNYSMTLVTLGDDVTEPNQILLSGHFAKEEFALKQVEDSNAARYGQIRYVGLRTIIGFKNKVQQTVFLAKNWSENGGRLLQLVVGGENVSYVKYLCTED